MEEEEEEEEENQTENTPHYRRQSPALFYNPAPGVHIPALHWSNNINRDEISSRNCASV